MGARITIEKDFVDYDLKHKVNPQSIMAKVRRLGV